MALYVAMKAKSYDVGSLEYALKKVVATDPTHLKAHTELAQLYIQNKRRQEAKTVLAKVYQLRGESVPSELQAFVTAKATESAGPKASQTTASVSGATSTGPAAKMLGKAKEKVKTVQTFYS